MRNGINNDSCNATLHILVPNDRVSKGLGIEGSWESEAISGPSTPVNKLLCSEDHRNRPSRLYFLAHANVMFSLVGYNH